MSGEKKHWQLLNPFRRVSGKRASEALAERSRGRVSSVYLPNDTSGFIVVPEFDNPVRIQAAHASEDSNPSPYYVSTATLPSTSPLSSNSIGNLYSPRPIGFYHNSYLGLGPCCASASDTNWDDRDDFSQRLSSAYERIRSMLSGASPNISLSSDPQMLRKQLGVPQHSVFNYPIHSCPDLPNPHSFPGGPMSPKLPPAAPPDESHVRTSKELGSHISISTNVYSFYPHSPDPLQCARRKSVGTTPTVTANSSLRRRTLGSAWSAHIACSPKPHPSISSPQKLVKRRIKKPAISSLSLPSSRRRRLKTVLRKPVTDTPSSTNAHEWQISLPQVRPPSPFKVDIPLHYTWHDRRVDFNPFSERHSKIVQFQETNSHRPDGNTEVLASIAWIGTPPMRSSSCTANRRRRHLSNPILPDRISMAIAVEDDISDDALVDRLEKVRRIGVPEPGRDISPSRFPDDAPLFGEEDETEPLLIAYQQSSSPQTRDRLINSRDVVLLPSSQDTISDSEDAELWHIARKALLCIREIIRTEKRYQEAIKMLLNAQTATPPPPSMASYISALVRTSETLLRSFLEDPSAWGVSAAFVTSEDELEATMVAWCAVVGAFFMDGNDSQSSGLIGRWRHRKSGVPGPSSMTQQISVSLSPQHPPMFPLVSTTSRNKDWVDERRGASPSEQERWSTFRSLQQPENKNQTVIGRPPGRKLSVRDLAIQPIQRVMRYVLLYRDLLDCTPSMSPSRLLVERAVEAATRIASQCDSAQKNPAFFRAS